MKELKLLLIFLTIASSISHVVKHKDVIKILNGIHSKDERRLEMNTRTVGVMTLPISRVLKSKIHQSILETHSGDQMTDELNELEKMSFFPSSYIKWLKDQNVQIVPIDIYSSDDEIEQIMLNIDGVLLTGGAVPLIRSDTKIRIDESFSAISKINDLSFYTRKVKSILTVAKRINDQGKKKFPVWGTCLGFEGIILAETGFRIKFSNIDNNNFNTNLIVNDDDSDSEFVKFFSKPEVEKMRSKKMFFFNHDHAFFTSDFYDDPELSNDYRLVASSDSKYFHNQPPIVAIIENKRYPFYGVQFHPEKNKYESKINADRSKTTLNILGKFGLFFTEKMKCQENDKKFEIIEEKLKNYNLYVATNIGVFDEIYILKKSTIE